MNAVEIAAVCHEANRAYCKTIGDDSQVLWEETKDYERHSAINGVRFAMTSPESSPEDQHEQWCNDKVAAGWKFGPAKDADKKEHPCLVPYDQLPVEQRRKDYLFRAIVHALTAE